MRVFRDRRISRSARAHARSPFRAFDVTGSEEVWPRPSAVTFRPRSSGCSKIDDPRPDLHDRRDGDPRRVARAANDRVIHRHRYRRFTRTDVFPLAGSL